MESDSNLGSGKFSLQKFFRKIGTSRHSGDDEPEFDYAAFSGLELPQQEMIKGIVELSEKNVREIMVPRVDAEAMPADVSFDEMVEAAYDAGHSRIPVYSETIDNIIGILYVKELLRFISDKPKKFDIKKLLHKPYFVPETMPLDELLVEFKKRRLHLAVAVDEYGGVAGIVSMEDVLEKKNIVGEINDEFDDDQLPEISRIAKNMFEVDSRASLSDVNDTIGLELPENEFDTIGGFVFDLFGKIPNKNEVVSCGHVSFKIKDIKGTIIDRIIITVAPHAGE